MSEMVDQVAQAIMDQAGIALPAGRKLAWEELCDGQRRSFIRDARAAIAAMREPTREMNIAGHHASHGELSDIEAGLVFKTMIEEALRG